MPEIAEVETVRNTLKRMILNKKIVDVKIIYPKIIESDINDFKKIAFEFLHIIMNQAVHINHPLRNRLKNISISATVTIITKA